MCLESIELAIILSASTEGASVGSVSKMDIRVTAKMGLTYETLLTLGAFKRFIVCLQIRILGW